MKLAFTGTLLVAVLMIALGSYLFLQTKEGAIFMMEQRGVALSPDSVMDAVVANDLEALSLMAQARLSFDEASSEGVTPLIEAVRSKRKEAVKLVLERVTNVDAADSAGMTALSHAMVLGDWETAGTLTSMGASVNVGLGRETPAIIDAAAAQEDELLGFLIDHGAEVDVRDSAGTAPLIQALAMRDGAMLEKLLEAGADPDTTDAQGNPAVLVAARLGDLDALRLLASHGAKLRPESDTAPTLLAVAVGSDDVAMVEFLIDAAGKPTAEDEKYIPLILSAVRRGNLALVESLVAAGAPLESEGPGGETALGAALGQGDEDLFFALLGGGASYGKLYDEILETENEELVTRFLSEAVDFGATTDDGETLLARMVREGRFLVARNLVTAGADVSVTCRDGMAVLDWAVAHRQPELVRILLEAGAESDARLAKPGEEFRGHFEEKQLSYYLSRDSNLTLLMVAAGSGQKEVVAHLLKHGAKTNTYTRVSKMYPVNFAAHIGNTDLMQMILGREAGDEVRKIELDLSEQRALLYVDGEVTISTAVSTGKGGYETPAGEYVITNKHRHWTSTIYGASMPYFMRLSCDSFGFHQGYTPQYPASHGCIRLPSAAAKKLFGTMEVGDLVVIKP